jgi:hypothetical protein
MMATLILMSGTDNADMTEETTLRGAVTAKTFERVMKDDPFNAEMFAAIIDAQSTAERTYEISVRN